MEKLFKPSIDWGNELVASTWWIVEAWAISAACVLAIAVLLIRYTTWAKRFWRVTGDYFTGTIRLFEVATGQERGRLDGKQGSVRCLAFSPDGRYLASGGDDNTVLIWDPTASLPNRRTGRPADVDKALKQAWDDFAGIDARQAGDAIWTFSQAPAEGVAFLRERLHPIKMPDDKKIARLIADLDSEDYAVRTRAVRDLELLDVPVETYLREALKQPSSPEAEQRLKDVLARVEVFSMTGERLRGVRAVEALELIATPEARRVLEDLAGGLPQCRLTQEAKAALRRLDARK